MHASRSASECLRPDPQSGPPRESSEKAAGDEKSVLICFEEGLRHGGLGAVVAEVARLSMTASLAFNLLPKARAPSASPSAAGSGRQRRPISGSRLHPSPAGASPSFRQLPCRYQALAAPVGSLN